MLIFVGCTVQKSVKLFNIAWRLQIIRSFLLFEIQHEVGWIKFKNLQEFN